MARNGDSTKDRGASTCYSTDFFRYRDIIRPGLSRSSLGTHREHTRLPLR